jgi:SAM-dependent methyltransferase
MPVSDCTAVAATPLQKADYGIDAPLVIRRFLLFGFSGLAAVIFLSLARRGWLPFWTRYLIVPCLAVGCTFLIQGGLMIWASKIGKLRLRDRLLDEIPWRGDEPVLDVGCGHGLMLIGAAKRLASGKATGIDLWQKEDQAGNSREATQANAAAEGTANRVELQDGDARKLPFPDASFDVILSSWALHNIYDRAGRVAALREIVRVMKQGGRLAIIDIRHTADYAAILKQTGMRDVSRRGPSFMFVIPSYTVTATKA